MLLGEEVIRVMTNTRRMSADVALWGAQKPLTCPGRQRTNTGREGSPGTYQDGDPVGFRLGRAGNRRHRADHGQRRGLQR